MYKISNNVKRWITEDIENWKVELTAAGKTVAEVKIKRSIFHGDDLSPLLFVIRMMSLSYILRKGTVVDKF